MQNQENIRVHKMTNQETEEARIEKRRKGKAGDRYEYGLDLAYGRAISIQKQTRIRGYGIEELFEYIFQQQSEQSKIPLYPRFVNPNTLRTLEDELIAAIQNTPTEEEIKKFMRSKKSKSLQRVYCEGRRFYRDVEVIKAEIDPETGEAITGTDVVGAVRKRINKNRALQIPGQQFFISTGSILPGYRLFPGRCCNKWLGTALWLDYLPEDIPGVVPKEANAYALGFGTRSKVKKLGENENRLSSPLTLDRLIGPVETRWNHDYIIATVKFYNIKE
jgi:hypothetical protein